MLVSVSSFSIARIESNGLLVTTIVRTPPLRMPPQDHIVCSAEYSVEYSAQPNKELKMIDGKTIYSIKAEDGEKTTITLDKLIADVLQKSLSDVHAWVQKTYESVTKKYPKLGRRKKGDLVRILSVREAQRYPLYNELVGKLL
jgi:hypothetical protein